MRRSQTAMEYLMTYSWAILVVLIVLAVLSYLGFLNPSGIISTRCYFPPGTGFSCVSFRLNSSITNLGSPYFNTIPYVYVGEGNLRLIIGQSTGNPIKITSIMCTQNTTFLGKSPMNTIYIMSRISIISGRTYYYPAYKDPLKPALGFIDHINMSSGTQKLVAGKIGNQFGAFVYCTGTGRPQSYLYFPNAQVVGGVYRPAGVPSPAQRQPGNLYQGKIYINYTDIKTGVWKVVIGDIVARYEV